MAESILDLIDVKFQDATSHVSTTSEDVIGMAMPYYWGESDKIITLYKTSFYEMFPESLPMGAKDVSGDEFDVYSGYAQIKSAFNHGAGAVEIFRPSAGWKWQRMTITSGGEVSDITEESEQYDEEKAINIGLKYAGYLPKSLAYGYDNVGVGVKFVNSPDYPDGTLVQIRVLGGKIDGIIYNVVTNTTDKNPKALGWFKFAEVADTTGKNPKTEGWYEIVNDNFVLTEDAEAASGKTYYTRTLAEETEPESDVTYYEQTWSYNYSDNDVLESFEGSTDPLANIGGESIYLENVVESQFINVRVFGSLNNIEDSTEETKKSFVLYSGITIGEEFKKGVKDAYKYFRDYESSNATIVINPFVKKELMADIDGDIASLAEYRKNCIAVVGYPTDSSCDFKKDDIAGYFGGGNDGVASNALGNKFCVALSGREYLTVFGQRFTSNCVGGYCGAMVNTAKEVRINQIASGYTYGMYGGSLKKSLLSGEAIDLMELGINSVYTSKRGNLIWGTRTMYSRQSSYFGKINVMRVCSMILRNIYPIAIETLHTDAASNPITRASVSTMLNSILDTYIANQDLHADSIADCSDAINTDYLTKGGTVLNIILRLHFIGLVERVSIKIIATDTSVTAEFV